MRKNLIIVGITLLLIIAAVWGGSAIYAAVQNKDTPEALALSTPTSAPTSVTSESPMLGGSGSPAASKIAGTWSAQPSSVVGYRVNEVLNGQQVTVVGRTSDVSGRFSIEGTRLSSGELTVKMGTVATDNSSRDGQFQSILKTAEFPTATFKLTKPVELGAASSAVTMVKAVGELSLAGTTREVAMDLQVQLSSPTAQVQAQIPIIFSDYGITAPNLGFVKVEHQGSLEILLHLER